MLCSAFESDSGRADTAVNGNSLQNSSFLIQNPSVLIQFHQFYSHHEALERWLKHQSEGTGVEQPGLAGLLVILKKSRRSVE